jgi:hypothetical protein
LTADQWIVCARAAVSHFVVSPPQTPEGRRAHFLSAELLSILVRNSAGRLQQAPTLGEVCNQKLVDLCSLLTEEFPDESLEEVICNFCENCGGRISRNRETERVVWRLASSHIPSRVRATIHLCNKGFQLTNKDRLLVALRGSNFKSPDHLSLTLKLIIAVYCPPRQQRTALRSQNAPDTWKEQSSPAAVPFFKELVIKDYVTPDNVHDFIVAAVCATGNHGFDVWIPRLQDTKLEPQVVQLILKVVQRHPHELPFSFLTWLAARVETGENDNQIQEIISSLFPTISEGLPDDLRRVFFRFIPAAIHTEIEKFDPSIAYDQLPSIKPICRILKIYITQLERQFVFEETSRLFRKLFLIAFQGKGAFRPILLHWKQFVTFHRWLLDETGMEISFQGNLPAEYADIRVLYENSLVCNSESFDVVVEELCQRLLTFEYWLHHERIQNDDNFLD